MIYRTLEKTGDDLSILGFGCMRFPEKNRKIDRERATRQIGRAIEQGINYFDTGYAYHMGESESFLGEALQQNGWREKIKLATKLPPTAVKVKEDMDHILNKQLKKLKTGSIDYYLLHGLDEASWEKLSKFDVLRLLDRAKADGRIVNAGFSFHGSKELFKNIVDAYDWHFCQIQYNYLDDEFQAGTEGLEYAASKGLGVMVMEPLRGGTLTAKIPPAIEAIWQDAEKARTPAEWALRWVWNRPEVSVVLSGMTEDAHLEENIHIANDARPNSLSTRELAFFDRAKAAYHSLLKAGCTGCRYCLPCPAGVDIPGCFDLYNRVASFGDPKLHNSFRYALRLGGMDRNAQRAYASQCVNCGACVEKCPQQLPIPELLQDVKKEYETFFLRIITLYGRYLYSRAKK